MLYSKIRYTLLAGLAGGCALAAGPRITALYHVGSWVRDLGRSRAFYEGYLGFPEAYVLNYPDGRLQMAVIKLNDEQNIVLFPDASKILPNGDNLKHLGLVTDDDEGLRSRLAVGGVETAPVHKGRIGDLILGIKDPAGCAYEVTQFEPDGEWTKHLGRSLPAGGPVRLHSATIATRDLAATASYYRDKLGFRPLSPAAGSVELQMPDGPDCLELKFDPAAGRPGGPRTVPRFDLEVTDLAETVAAVNRRASAAGFAPLGPIQTGRDGRREVSCVDPDGTTVVLSEKRPD